MDEEDVRYDVFSMIYDMLFDNIQLRSKMNKLSTRIMNLSQSTLEKTVHTYFKQHHKTVSSAVALATAKFKTELYQEVKNSRKGKGPLNKNAIGAFSMTPGDPKLNDSFESDDSYGEMIESSKVTSDAMKHDLFKKKT